MASHVYHPDIHEEGLQDGCPRCEEHSMHPFASLDDRMLGALISRVEQSLDPRSDNEAVAMLAVRTNMAAAQRVVQWQRQ